MKCIKCSTSSLRNWIFYLCVAFIPVTIFYIGILIIRVNVTSPKLMAYVLVAQTLATPASVRIIIYGLETYPNYLWACKIGLALYGIWNLDFFRTFMPPICLNISTLQVHALDYAHWVW